MAPTFNPDALVECVPNYSEGTDAEIVRRIVAAMRVDAVRLLDWSLDHAHNRSVVTIAGPPLDVMESAVRGATAAARLIDLTRQRGVHPRIGAADVIPFVPVRNMTLGDCAILARQTGIELWRRAGVPVYFYEAAAARADRIRLEDVRQGQFEGLRESARRDPTRRPDIGGPELHATAGASAIGARPFLIAYNIYIEPTAPSAPGADIAAARAIARAIRASNGGMHGVKALGVLANGRAQVSMNITDFRTTPVPKVHAAVRDLARSQGARTAEGELIGLIPEAACDVNADWIREIPAFDPDAKVLERKLQRPIDWPV